MPKACFGHRCNFCARGKSQMAIIDTSPDAMWGVCPKAVPPLRVENISYASQYSGPYQDAMGRVTWHVCDATGRNVMKHPAGCMFTTKEIAERVLERVTDGD